MVRALRNNITSLRNYFSGDTNETNVTKNLIKLLQSEFTISLFKVYAITFFSTIQNRWLEFKHLIGYWTCCHMDHMIWLISYGPYSMDHTVYMTATQFTLSNNAEKNNLWRWHQVFKRNTITLDIQFQSV